MIKNLLFTLVLGLSFINLQAQNYLMDKPEGFGAAATGGGTATPVTVTDYANLKAQLSASAAGVILVSGTITIPDGEQIRAIVKNKTLIGLPGAKLVNNTQTKGGSGILYLSEGSNNVIIRNLIFEGPGAYDTDGRDNLTSDGCTNLWVDHCEFQDGTDGNFDMKGKTDNVTVSWCKFTYLKPPKAGGSGGSDDHRYSDLLGSSKSSFPADGHYSITFQNCYWADGCKERMPRARNAELHILNCYYNTNVSGSLAMGLGGGDKNLTCYVEGTDFAKIGSIFKKYDNDGGTVSVNYVDCPKKGTDIGTVTKPLYTYTAYPVADVATFVPNTLWGAGANLQVSSEGVISIDYSDKEYSLSSETSGTGTGTVEFTPAGGSYVAGTVVTIVAQPERDSKFVGWSDGATGTTNPTTINISADSKVIAEFQLRTTDINTTSEKAVVLYPSLVEDILNIDFSNTENGQALVNIYSLSGQNVFTLSKYIEANEKIKLDLSSLSQGVYFCNIQVNNLTLKRKLIKK